MDLQQVDSGFPFKRDPGFQKLDSGFQNPVFRIPQAKISWIPESGLPYMGRIPYNVFKFSTVPLVT